MSDLQKFIRQFLFDSNWSKSCDISSLSLSKIQQIDSTFSHIDVKSKISILFSISNSKNPTESEISEACKSILENALNDENKFVKSIATILSLKSKNQLNFDLYSNNDVFEKNMLKLERLNESNDSSESNSFFSEFLESNSSSFFDTGFKMRGKSKAISLRDQYLEKIEEDCMKRRIHVPIPGKGFNRDEKLAESKNLCTNRMKNEFIPKKIPEPLKDLSFVDSNRPKIQHSRPNSSNNKPGIKILDFDDLPAQGPKAKQLKREQLEKEREQKKKEKEEKARVLKAAREAAKQFKTVDITDKKQSGVPRTQATPKTLDKFNSDDLINASLFDPKNVKDPMDESSSVDMDQTDTSIESRNDILRQELIDSSSLDDLSNNLLSTNYQAPPSVLPPASSSRRTMDEKEYTFTNFTRPNNHPNSEDSDDDEDDMALLPPTPAFNPSHDSINCDGLRNNQPSHSLLNNNQQQQIFSNSLQKPTDAQSQPLSSSQMSTDNYSKASNVCERTIFSPIGSSKAFYPNQQFISLSDPKYNPQMKNNSQTIYLVANNPQQQQQQQQHQTIVSPTHQNNNKIFITLNQPTSNQQLSSNQNQKILLSPPQQQHSQQQQQQQILTALTHNNLNDKTSRFVQIRPNTQLQSAMQQQQQQQPTSFTAIRQIRPQIIQMHRNIAPATSVKKQTPSKIEANQIGDMLILQKSPDQQNMIRLAPDSQTNQKQIFLSPTNKTISNQSSTQPFTIINANQNQPQQQQVRLFCPNPQKDRQGQTSAIGQFIVINPNATATLQPVQQQQKSNQNILSQPNIFQFYQQPLQTTVPKIINCLSPPQSRQQAMSNSQSNTLDASNKNVASVSIQDDLSLSEQQMMQVETLLEGANKISRPEIASIIGFIAGNRDASLIENQKNVEYLLSEYQERVFDRNSGEMVNMAAKTFINLDYAQGKIERVKRYQKFDQAVIELMPTKNTNQSVIN